MTLAEKNEYGFKDGLSKLADYGLAHLKTWFGDPGIYCVDCEGQASC